MSERKFKVGDRVIIRSARADGFTLPLRDYAKVGRRGRVVSVLSYRHEYGVKFMNVRTGAFLKDVHWFDEAELEGV